MALLDVWTSLYSTQKLQSNPFNTMRCSLGVRQASSGAFTPKSALRCPPTPSVSSLKRFGTASLEREALARLNGPCSSRPSSPILPFVCLAAPAWHFPPQFRRSTLVNTSFSFIFLLFHLSRTVFALTRATPHHSSAPTPWAKFSCLGPTFSKEGPSKLRRLPLALMTDFRVLSLIFRCVYVW